MHESDLREKSTLAIICIALLTALCLIGISFKIVLLPPVTTMLAEQTVNDQLSAVDHATLVKTAEQGRAYVAGDRGAQMPEGDDERIAFTPDAVSHMKDVRYVISGAQILTLVLVILLIALAYFTGRSKGILSVASGFFFGGIGAVLGTLVLVIFGALNFDALFTGMHEIFFADGTWTFAADSLLICAYPEAFWLGMAIVWAVSLVFLSVFLSTVGFLLRRPTRG
jgi:integral membrane protein (TIGR01906 family)